MPRRRRLWMAWRARRRRSRACRAPPRPACLPAPPLLLARSTCRQMNGPVHEVQHIPRQLDAATAAALPLGDLFEHDPPACQALHLSATPGAGAGGGAAACVAAAHSAAAALLLAAAPLLPSAHSGLETSPASCPAPSSLADLLLGRSDNGMCWLFDLSERMGWADGSQRGSWLRGTRCRSGAGGLAAGREASERHADAEAAAQVRCASALLPVQGGRRRTTCSPPSVGRH